MGASRSGILEELARRIRQIEGGARPHSRSRASMGIAALDELLPERGLRRGTLVELLSAADGAGAWTLGVVIARHVCGERRALVVLDAERQFYPPAAARLGLDLNRTIVVRPESGRDAYRAAVESLRCTAVGTVLGWHPRLSMLDFRRLQLAAESGGGMGILLRPAVALRAPSCAALRLLVAPATAPSPLPLSPKGRGVKMHSPLYPWGRGAGGEGSRRDGRLVRVDVVRCRGGRCGQSLMLEIDDETGDVHLPARLASGAAVARSARASG